MMINTRALKKQFMSELRDATRIECRARREQSKIEVLKSRRLNLSEIEASVQAKVSVAEFSALSVLLKNSGAHVKVLRRIKTGLCSGNADLVECFFRVDGAFCSLISALLCCDGERQLEAAAVITNLACGSHKSCHKLAKRAGVYLISHITGGNHFMQDQCAWAAGNIAEDCEVCFGVLKSQGLLPALRNLLKSPNEAVAHSALFCLNACMKYEDANVIEMVKSGGIEHIILNIMQKADLERSLFIEASLALSNICCLASHLNTDVITAEIAEAVLKRLNETVTSKSRPFDILIATPLIRCLGYMTGVSEPVCKCVTDYPELESVMYAVMYSQFHHLKKELLWVLSNVLASEEAQLDLKSIIPAIEKIHIFLNPIDPSVIQTLYFLCQLAQKKEYNVLLIVSGILQRVELLLSCDKEGIKEAANIFLMLIK